MENKINESEKSEKKETINYSLYSDQPEKLFSIAQTEFDKNNFEEGLDILEQSILLAVKKFGGEDKIELAQFYNKYANGLLQKLMVSNTDFLNLQDGEQQKEDVKEEKQKENKSNDEESEIKEKSKDDKEKEDEKSANKGGKGDVGDDEIAYENLNMANVLLKNYLKEYDDKDPKTLDKDVIKYYNLLSDNYSLFASLEKINSDFKKANEYYKLSIEISKKYDNKFSRNLAGLYFEQAQILDFDPYTCLLSLYKSKVIMEYYLQQELDKANIKLKLYLDEADLDLTTLSYDSDKVFKNKDLVETNIEIITAAKINSKIQEFVEIIKDINIKIEDVVLELKEYSTFLKTKEQMKKEGENQNTFNTNIDMSKVVDLSKITLIKKKRKEPSNSDDDIKAPDDINTKEKKMD